MKATIITQLPIPNFIVTDPMKNHKYKIIFTDDRPAIEKLKSVTGQLNIIGGEKTGILMNWAKKQVVLRAEQLIHDALKNPDIPLTAEMVSEMLQTAKKEPKKIFEEAGDLGDVVHKYIDGWIKCYLIKKEFHFENYVSTDNKFFEKGKIGYNSFLEWMKQHKMIPICGDLAVGSVKYKYAGRLDAIFTDGKYLYLLDWKTANYMSDEFAGQVGGYNQGLLETYGFKCTRGIVARFDKNDENVFETHVVNMEAAHQLWMDVLKLNKSYKHEKVWREPKVKKVSTKTVKTATKPEEGKTVPEETKTV